MYFTYIFYEMKIFFQEESNAEVGTEVGLVHFYELRGVHEMHRRIIYVSTLFYLGIFLSLIINAKICNSFFSFFSIVYTQPDGTLFFLIFTYLRGRSH